jgi:outer membrane autotransporter protein
MDVTFTIAKGSQSITFGTAPTIAVGGTGTVSATGGASGNPVIFTSTTTGVCTVSGTNGSTVTSVSAGTCTIAANQAGNASYAAATQVTQNIGIGITNQTITFGGAPTIAVGSSGTVSATGGASGNPVIFTSTTTGVCTVSGTNGSTVTGVSAGTCTIAANQAGNASYAAATQVTQNISISAGITSQTITFGTAPTIAVGGTGTVSATGGASGNPVIFTSTTTGVCTVSGTNGSTVTVVSAGTCIIAANQAGNTNYSAAPQVTQNITATVTARPDPAKDVAVVGLLAAQTDTARHFSRAQISNFQHRMESLHRRGNNETGASPGLAAGASLTATAGSTAPVVANKRLDGGSDMPPNNNPLLRVSEAPAVSSLPDPAGAGQRLKPVEFANNIVSLLTTQSLNLSSVSSLADGDAASGTMDNNADVSGFWAAGTLNFGTRAATDSSSELGFSTSGISFGFDRRLSDRSALGVGLGFARDKTDIGNDGSQSRANGSSIAVYGSYQPNRNTFIDGLIGFGSLKFETQRYVLAANDYARGNRDGYQAFGSLAAGYEHRDNGLLVSPYARLNYSSNQLKQSTETGTGQFDLSYFSQTSSAIQGALGVRAEAIHPTSFGIASPRIRAEYQHDFQGQRQATVVYADLPGGPQYAIPAGATKRNAIAFGIGNDFVTRSGATFGIDYQILHTFSQDTNYAVLLQFSKKFDERGSSTSPGGYPILTPSTPLGIQVDSSYTFDNNVTRGDKTKLVDSSYAVSLRKIAIFPVSDNTRALLTGLLDGDKFYRYDGLSRITGGVQGELQYRRSAEFSAATFGLFARASADQYNSDLRDGRRYSTGMSMLQPMTDRIRMFAALAHNRRNGKNAVFDDSDNAARLNLDYELDPISTFYLSGEYRRGDVVTTGSGLYSASVSAVDDAFPGRQLYSARLDGSTVITSLGYNMGLGSRDSFDFSWRRVHSTIDAASSSGLYATSTPASGYTSNQYSVAYLVRF